MKKSIVFLMISLTATTAFCKDENLINTKTPYQIIADAPNKDWRDLDINNTLYITLDSGVVVVELAPQFAPMHVENTKNLVKEGVFNKTSFYRVIDGFVAQGGPADPEKIPQLKNGKLTIDAEFAVSPNKPFEFTPLNAFDGYAEEVGYVDGFPVGRSKDGRSNWLLHCYGALAMGRANEANSGGTELYIVIGTAQRYLDRNTTVFGKVISGMQHIQSLQRSSSLSGEVDVSKDNKIISIKVASDLKPVQRLDLQTMKTNSNSFKALIKSRKNRNGEWFLHQHDYIDVCSVAVPVRINKN